MPFQRTRAAQRGGRERSPGPEREEWDPSVLSAGELLRLLGSDAERGLSVQEAARRRARRPSAPLFGEGIAGFGACLRRLLRDPVFWALPAVCLLALLFRRVAIGLCCLLLTAGRLAAGAWILRRSLQVEAAMQAQDAPLARVRRGGRLFRVCADGLVRGDLIFLRAGDIVPADCRLLTSDRLTVTERDPDGGAPARLRKDAGAEPARAGEGRTSPANMVLAGSVCETGSASALVTSAGPDARLYALTGGVRSAHPPRDPRGLSSARLYASRWNLLSVVLLIPLIAVGILTVGDRYELLDLFLTALALAAASSGPYLAASERYLGASIRAAAATDPDRNSACDVKTSEGLERLSAMTDLLLLGSAALHDGLPHPVTLSVGNAVFRCADTDPDETARRAAGMLDRYARAFGDGTGPLPEAARAARAFAAWADAGDGASEPCPAALSVSADGTTVTATEPSGAVRGIRLTDDPDALGACAYLSTGTSARPADPALLSGVAHAFRQALREGRRALLLLSEEEGRITFEALLTYAPRACPKTAGVVAQMERAGIRVIAFADGAPDESARFFAECGLTDSAPPDRPSPGAAVRPVPELVAEGVRAFVGRGRACVEAYIRTLRAEGRVVGALSADRDDLPLLAAADIAIACAPSLFAAALRGEARLPAGVCVSQDGTSEGPCATDLSRRLAEVVVRRSAADGGGVCGVRRALLAAERYRDALRTCARFRVASETLRLLTVLLPLCAGLALVPAPALLLSGFAADAIVLLAAARLPVGSAVGAPRPRLDALDRPWVAFRPAIVAAALSAAAAWGAVLVGSLRGARFGADLGYYAFLCLSLVQTALFLTGRLPLRVRAVFFALLALACLLIGGYAAALSAGLSWIWCLLVPLLPTAVFLLSLGAARWFRRGGRTRRRRSR